MIKTGEKKFFVYILYRILRFARKIGVVKESLQSGGAIGSEVAPRKTKADAVFWVGETSVTLNTVLAVFPQGATALTTSARSSPSTTRKQKMGKIIVTDLTRFSKPDQVCIAGIDIETGECIRPLPYLSSAECEKLHILPGTILSGNFTKRQQVEGPHQEDSSYQNLSFHSSCSSDEFKKVLEYGLVNSLEDGFNIKLDKNQKHIPIGHALNHSIITVKVHPKTINIAESSYKPGKMTVSFCDWSNRWFNYMSITDLNFYNYAMKHHEDNNLDSLNKYIKSRQEAYLRIGLSRIYKSNGREGYWIQVNGIYTFPDYKL